MGNNNNNNNNNNNDNNNNNLNQWKVSNTVFFSHRVILLVIYSSAISIVLRAFSFSDYIFEELEIFNLDSCMTNLLHIDKNITEINFENAKHWRFSRAKIMIYIDVFRFY